MVPGILDAIVRASDTLGLMVQIPEHLHSAQYLGNIRIPTKIVSSVIHQSV